MADALSPRLARILGVLPWLDGLRVLEVGCGPGALARAMASRGATVLGLDRSAAAIRTAEAATPPELAPRLTFRQGRIEDFRLAPGEAPFDLAVAVRVGALDGRQPDSEGRALDALAAALGPAGRLFIDGMERPVRRG
jgi:2-polyprenyl-3-methyl-5-hydroxy-6-metoxy-1,4-benzoquinol methylase